MIQINKTGIHCTRKTVLACGIAIAAMTSAMSKEAHAIAGPTPETVTFTAGAITDSNDRTDTALDLTIVLEHGNMTEPPPGSNIPGNIAKLNGVTGTSANKLHAVTVTNNADLGDDMQGTAVEATQELHADTITITTNRTILSLVAGGSGTVNLNADNAMFVTKGDFTGDIVNTTGTNYQGRAALVAEDTDVTYTGNIGSNAVNGALSGVSLIADKDKTLTVTGNIYTDSANVGSPSGSGGNVILDGNITVNNGLGIGEGSIVTLKTGHSITGNVITHNNDQGTLILENGASLINSNVGSHGNKLKELQIQGNLSFSNNMHANTISLADGKMLTLDGSSTQSISGNLVGGTNSALKVDNSTQFDGDITVAHIAIANDQTLEMLSKDPDEEHTLTGEVTGYTNTSIKIGDNTKAVINAKINSITNVKVEDGATATFKKNITLGQHLLLNGGNVVIDDATTKTITNNYIDVTFNGDSTLTIGENDKLTGTVRTATDGNGSLILNSGASVGTLHDGTVVDLGETAKKLKAVTVKGSTSIGSNIYAHTTHIADDQTLTLDGSGLSQVIDGNISGGTNTTLAVNSAASVTGDITVNTITLADSKALTLNGTTTQTISGNVGGGDNGQQLILVNNANLQGHTDLNFIIINNGKTLTLNGSSAQNISGGVIGTAANLAINNDATFNHAVNVQTVTIGDAKATINGNLFLSSNGVNFTDDGTLEIDASGNVSSSADTKVTTDTNNTGTLTFHKDLNINQIGASDKKLKEVKYIGDVAASKLKANVYATTLSLNGSEGFELDGTLTGGSVASTNTGALTLHAVTLSGGITHAGALNINDRIVVNGNIDIGDNPLKFAQSSSEINGDIVSGTITNEANLHFYGTRAQTIYGDIITTNALNPWAAQMSTDNPAGVTFKGTLSGLNSFGTAFPVTFEKTVSTKVMQAGNGANITFGAANNTITTLTVNDGAQISLLDTIVDGDTVITGAIDVESDDGNQDSKLLLPSTFTSGEIILANTGGDAAFDEFEIIDTKIADYELVSDGDKLVARVASTATPEQLAHDLGITRDKARETMHANTAVTSGDDAGKRAITNALAAGGEAARKMAEQVSLPDNILASSMSSAVSTGAEVISVTQTRLASLRMSDSQFASAGQTGFSSGDEGLSKSMWAQPFGNWLRKKDTHADDGTYYGYDAETYGVAMGADMDFGERMNAGLSFAYSNTNVEGNGPSEAKDDINTYQITMYGDYTAERFFVEGMIGYALSTNDVQRTLNFGGLNRTASGDYNSQQYMLHVEGGMPLHLNDRTLVQPTVGLAYTYVSADSYTETGAGNLNQSVDPDDISVLVGSIGAKINTKFNWQGGILAPDVRVGLSYDFIGDESSATGKYAGGGATFTVEGAKAEQFGGNVGLGLVYRRGTWTFGGHYDADMKKNYMSHTGKVEARMAF